MEIILTARKSAFAALLILGFSVSASAQFRVFDPEINRQAAECASTGNCMLNNMEMNNHRGEDFNALQDWFAREDAERERYQKQGDEEDRRTYGRNRAQTKQDYQRALKVVAATSGKDNKSAKQLAKAAKKTAP